MAVVKPQALTLADIDKIYKTEGAQAADAALQAMKLAREAREAEAPEAEAPSDIENLDDLLRNLELGADETGEVIEHLGELDASGEDAVEGVIAKAEAYEAQDVLDEARKEPMKLREQMHAKLAEINGGDPLAKDKKKASNALKKVGRTLADLPPDWDKLPRITKIPLERSRQSEFYRVFREGEEEMREAERLRELEKRGRPANYDLLPVDERDRINVNIRQRQHRDKKRKHPSKPTVVPLPVADIAPDMLRHTLANMLRSLEKWAVNYSTPLARQLRKREQQLALIRAAAAYARYFNSHDEPPSRSDLAKGLRCTKDQARRKLDVLKSLYAPGGPWAGA
jgi:hypothetical protein